MSRDHVEIYNTLLDDLILDHQVERILNLFTIVLKSSNLPKLHMQLYKM
jgi:hypothetical protein